MEFSTANIIQIAIYLITLGTFGGTIMTRLANLERKMDKHNGIVEKVYRCEESLKSVHHRLDEIKDDLK